QTACKDDVSRWLKRVHFQAVVVDEAHRCKSASSRLTRLVRALSQSVLPVDDAGATAGATDTGATDDPDDTEGATDDPDDTDGATDAGATERKPWLLLLTGTPIQNDTAEVWSLLHLLAPQRFDSERDFLKQFGEMQTHQQLQELDRLMRPYVLRRRKADLARASDGGEADLRLPPREEIVLDVEFTLAQKKYYRSVFDRNADHLASKVQGVGSLRNMAMQLRKCCCHPFLL
ncbi:MAG: hypothetical protein MHM6MM_009399, partial [Cercozoa sp. M6MM]